MRVQQRGNVDRALQIFVQYVIANVAVNNPFFYFLLEGKQKARRLLLKTEAEKKSSYEVGVPF